MAQDMDNYEYPEPDQPMPYGVMTGSGLNNCFVIVFGLVIFLICGGLIALAITVMYGPGY